MKTELTYTVERDGDWWIAKCAVLDIAGIGVNASTARRNMLGKLNFYLSETPYMQVEKALRDQGVDIEMILVEEGAHEP